MRTGGFRTAGSGNSHHSPGLSHHGHGGGVALPGLAAAQQAASQLAHAASNALGDGPIAQGMASAASTLGGLLQPSGFSSRLNVRSQKDCNKHWHTQHMHKMRLLLCGCGGVMAD